MSALACTTDSSRTSRHVRKCRYRTHAPQQRASLFNHPISRSCAASRYRKLDQRSAGSVSLRCPIWSLGNLLILDAVLAGIQKDAVLVGIQRQVSSQKGYIDRLGFVPARDDRAFTPALSYRRKKQVEPIRHRKWIMHHQLGSILIHECHCTLVKRRARRANPNRNKNGLVKAFAHFDGLPSQSEC